MVPVGPQTPVTLNHEANEAIKESVDDIKRLFNVKSGSTEDQQLQLLVKAAYLKGYDHGLD